MEQLYDMRGSRKYLTQHERDRFLKSRPIRSDAGSSVLRSSRLHRLPDLRGACPDA